MNEFNERFVIKLRQVPYIIPLLVTIISVYGFVLLYSASGGELSPWASRQIIVFAIYLPIAIFIALIDIRFIYQCSYLFYLITLFLLILVEFTGKKAMGATRWIDLGIIHIQPSELVKISTVLMLSKYFHEIDENKISNLTALIPPLIAVLIPAALIIKQPDLGTGIITLIVALVIFFAVGVRLLYFALGGIGILCLIPVIWMSLHDYQKSRVLIFFDPERDPLGKGYNIIQSQIAIGSGGFTGKGLLSGTQSHLSFLPEYQTDFIFSFLTEELGFLGGALLLILYAFLIIMSLAIGINSRTRYIKLMVVGIASIFFSHIFINIAMVMGLLPVVGVPLPLMSYGGTMMVTMLVSFGLIMNAGVNQRSNI